MSGILFFIFASCHPLTWGLSEIQVCILTLSFHCLVQCASWTRWLSAWNTSLYSNVVFPLPGSMCIMNSMAQWNTSLYSNVVFPLPGSMCIMNSMAQWNTSLYSNVVFPLPGSMCIMNSMAQWNTSLYSNVVFPLSGSTRIMNLGLNETQVCILTLSFLCFVQHSSWTGGLSETQAYILTLSFHCLVQHTVWTRDSVKHKLLPLCYLSVARFNSVQHASKTSQDICETQACILMLSFRCLIPHAPWTRGLSVASFLFVCSFVCLFFVCMLFVCFVSISNSG